jgi:hypothetical protein
LGLRFQAIGVSKKPHLFIMKLRAFFITFLLATVALHAEFRIGDVLASAKSDPKNAPAIIAFAAVDNPRFLLPLLSGSVEALPDQAVEIVRALLKVAPNKALDIVRVAIQAQPKLAVKISSVAVALLPDQADQIIKVAGDTAAGAPETAEASPTGGDIGPNGAAGASPSAPPFPAQPIRPDLVSPSS